MAAQTANGERVVLEGVDRYRVMEPLFECVRVVLAYRGEAHSPAYIQGISGAAYRIAGICPCAPTCSSTMETQELIEMLGYHAECLSLCEEGMDPDAEVGRVVARVKDEVRAGRPAIVWHAFTWAEWDVVCGFDVRGKAFLGRGSYAGLEGYASADQRRTATCGEICPPLGAILVGGRTGSYDARSAEIASLLEAVRHAHSQANVDKPGEDRWVMLDGLACYSRWVDDMRTLSWVPGMDDRYCLGVYRSTRRAAAEFVRELMPKYPAASDDLEAASRAFAAEADALNACAELLFPGWQLPKGASPEANRQAAALIARAREGYAEAIDNINCAVSAITS